ncbi:hypothetical protein [Pelagibacterium luteolum]|uniref:Ribbon-helix-helix protein, copG family n=1 Tax=Pelagibacterium luteolum TaxID=440168 RepID=A0A1G7S7G3_9HYPH|nr:hypothetical protein [Pelagibacterium luteolum]SDG18882.1 hypothetical protein SAMN04487974_101345 [Pelagibacterium luteolum]
MRSKLQTRDPLDDRLHIAITPEQKRQAFEAAARKGVSVSQLMRVAIDKAINSPREPMEA